MTTYRIVLFTLTVSLLICHQGWSAPRQSEFMPQQLDGQCGKTDHDCTAAINRCIDAAYAKGQLYSACFLPAGKYFVSGKIMFCAAIEGISSSGTVIAASSLFSGSYVVDFNCPHGSQNYIQNITFDLRDLGPDDHVTAFGSSSAGGGGGNSMGHFTSITVLSSSRDTFAVEASSKKAEPGMFTGSVWNSLIISAPCNLAIGTNQDDGTITGLRTDITAPCSHAGSAISVSSNWKLIDSYVAVGASNGGAPVTCGTNTDLDGLFIESGGAVGVHDPWLIQYDAGALGPCKISRLNANIAIEGGAPDAAMIRVNIPSGPNHGQGIVLGNFAISSGHLPTPVLFSVFNAGTNPQAGPLAIVVQGSGWDAFTGNFAKMGTGGTANTGEVLKFSGNFGGHGGASLRPRRRPAVAQFGFPSYLTTKSSASRFKFDHGRSCPSAGKCGLTLLVCQRG